MKRRVGDLLLCLCVWGCGTAATPAGYPIDVVVDGPTAPLPAVPILRDGTTLGVTGSDGRARLRLQGIDGDVARLNAKCPDDYQTPKAPIDVPLYRLGEGSRPPLYRIACRRSVNTVVVAIRATNGPDLPVLYLGKEVARTDASGAAHVELHVRAGERFELALNTRVEGRERLLPENPTAVFVAKERDELVFFDQRFDVPRRRALRRGPQRF